jgi:putative transposase
MDENLIDNSGKHALISLDVGDVAQWPCPDAVGLPSAQQPAFLKRKLAVTLYASKVAMEEISRQTGYTAKEVRRTVKRCITPTGAGSIVGFYGCIPALRVKNYERRKSLEFLPETQKGGRSGGLGAIFTKFPSVEDSVQALFLKRKSAGPLFEAKIQIRVLHEAFLNQLRTLGVKEYDWPFNTAKMGYEAIRRYCKLLETQFSDEHFAARHSEEGIHKHKIGRGHNALFTSFRPFTYLELDYNKVDAACIIVITNRYGIDLDVVLPRWYFGLITDAHTRLITGVFIAFEESPSSDGLLETVQSAVFPAIYVDTDPRSKYLVDASVLSDNLIPELTHQTFAVLKLDNAWANASVDAINQLMDLTGCAINFGPPGEWSRRPTVENIFDKLTARGMKRLPSTYGSNPKDPIRRNPEAQAATFRIRARDVAQIIADEVKAHNQFVSGGREYSAPVEIVNAAIANPDSGFISQQLSKEAIRNSKFEYRRFERRVVGYPNKGTRPYINLDECIYTNPKLSSRDDLIGKWVLIFVHRRDVRDAYGIVVQTGEPLGQLAPETRWSYAAVSVRHRQHINKAGNRRQNKQRSDPARDWYAQTANTLLSNAKTQSPLASTSPRKSSTAKATKKDVLALVSAELPTLVDIPQAPTTESDPSPKSPQRQLRIPSAFDIDIPLIPIRIK